MTVTLLELFFLVCLWVDLYNITQEWTIEQWIPCKWVKMFLQRQIFNIGWLSKTSRKDPENNYLVVDFFLVFLSSNYPGWSPRDNQRWTALFQRFDVIQSWFRAYEKHQHWPALFQSWSARIFSESALFGTEKFSSVSDGNSSESALFSADFLSFEALGFLIWTALIQRWFTLN